MGNVLQKYILEPIKLQNLGETYPNHVGAYYWILFGYKLVQAITERKIWRLSGLVMKTGTLANFISGIETIDIILAKIFPKMSFANYMMINDFENLRKMTRIFANEFPNSF